MRDEAVASTSNQAPSSSILMNDDDAESCEVMRQKLGNEEETKSDIYLQDLPPEVKY